MRDGPFDCIFLKNVLIYFDTESKRAVVRRVVEALAPGGYLVVGPTEGIFSMLDPWSGSRAGSTASRGGVTTMSGFDLSELLPFYLDETDEQIGTLNDSLLRLERDPADAHALQETFRDRPQPQGLGERDGLRPGQPPRPPPGDALRPAPRRQAAPGSRRPST